MQSRTLWLALVIVVGLVATLLVSGQSAAAPAAADLRGSDMAAGRSTLAPGETVEYTITLRNSGSSGTVANVSAPLPSQLAYVAGSATGGGYKQGNALVWNNVSVPGGASVALKFRVGPAVTVSTNTIVVSLAAISSNTGQFIRTASITLIPTASPAPAHLAGSDKTASKSTLAPEETLTFIITVRNSGSASAIVSVTDPLPDRLEYVGGSASDGGVYDGATKTVSWSNVSVPAGASMPLTFQVRSAVHVIAPSPLTNTATITSGGVSFERSVSILLVMLPLPPDPPTPNLVASYKTVSQRKLASGDTLTYTIHLHNSAISDATAQVTDPIPADLDYIPNSVTGGGVYDASTRTLSWSGVSVPAGSSKLLTFAVTGESVSEPKRVVNTATISVGGRSFERKATIVLVPELTGDDIIPPTVRDLTIDGQDVLTSRTVTLHVLASDNVAVTRMYLREWQLSTTPWPHWQIVQSSGWVPYQSEYPWTLGAKSGTHFVGVWVSDTALNVSHLNRQAIDFASLLLPDTTVPLHGKVPYLVHYEAGVQVNATLTPSEGDADLYVWYPGSFGGPDKKSTNSGTAVDSVSFTTPRAGNYLFLVHGYTAATYDLSITPAGGPQATTITGAPAFDATQAEAAKPDELSVEPILSQSGLDPLDDNASPGFAVFLPIVVR
jgi:uncharacterized repeat protein (TIGR01451 family)